MVGVVRAGQVAVISCGVEQLAQISLALLRSAARGDSRFATKEVRSNVFSVAGLVVRQLVDSPLQRQSSFALAPYFSLTNNKSMAIALCELANAVSDAAADSDQARRILANLKDWADDLYDPFKQLLLAAIEKRSSLTGDLLQWVGQLTKVLVASSMAPACTERLHDELTTSASWLVATLSWIPGDAETIKYLEAHSLANVLFDIGIDSYKRGCPKVAQQACELVTGWAFKAGKHPTGWASLHTALCGSVALCANGVILREDLLASVDAGIAKAGPSLELRFRAAEELSESANSLHQFQHSTASIDAALGQIDPEVLRPLLQDVAQRLVPELNETVD